MFNFLLYICIFILVVWTVDGININSIFKSNKVYQARIFYILLIVSITELVTSSIIDFINCLN